MLISSVILSFEEKTLQGLVPVQQSGSRCEYWIYIFTMSVEWKLLSWRTWALISLLKFDHSRKASFVKYVREQPSDTPGHVCSNNGFTLGNFIALPSVDPL